jgi:hypothetical protein
MEWKPFAAYVQGFIVGEEDPWDRQRRPFLYHARGQVVSLYPLRSLADSHVDACTAHCMGRHRLSSSAPSIPELATGV